MANKVKNKLYSLFLWIFAIVFVFGMLAAMVEYPGLTILLWIPIIVAIIKFFIRTFK